MSFYGWGITDLLMAIKLCNTIHEALIHATGEFRTYQASVHGLSTSLEIVRSWANEPQNTDLKFEQTELDTLSATIPQLQIATDRYLDSLGGFLHLRERPNGLTVAQWGKKQMEKLLWHMKDRKDIKEQRDAILALHSSIGLILANRNQRDHRVIYNKVAGIYPELAANSDQVTQNVRQVVLESKDEIIQEFRTLIFRYVLEQNVQPAIITTSTSEATMESTNDDANSALNILKNHGATGSQISIGTVSLQVDFKVQQAFGNWLNPPSDRDPSCLWLYGEDAAKLSSQLIAIRAERGLTTINFKCQRLDDDGKEIERAQILQKLSYLYLYQILHHIVNRQDKPATPITIDLPAFDGLDGTSKSTLQALNLAQSLLESTSEDIVWVIDDFEWLEGGELLEGSEREAYQENMKALLQLIGYGQVSASGKRKTLITTKANPGMLIDAVLNGRLADLKTAGLVGGKNRYDFREEVEKMIPPR